MLVTQVMSGLLIQGAINIYLPIGIGLVLTNL